MIDELEESLEEEVGDSLLPAALQLLVFPRIVEENVALHFEAQLVRLSAVHPQRLFCIQSEIQDLKKVSIELLQFIEFPRKSTEYALLENAAEHLTHLLFSLVPHRRADIHRQCSVHFCIPDAQLVVHFRYVLLFAHKTVLEKEEQILQKSLKQSKQSNY